MTLFRRADRLLGSGLIFKQAPFEFYSQIRHESEPAADQQRSRWLRDRIKVGDPALRPAVVREECRRLRDGA